MFGSFTQDADFGLEDKSLVQDSRERGIANVEICYRLNSQWP